MKSLFIAGNWKSNKTISESDEWLNAFAQLLKEGGDLPRESLTIVVCPPFTMLAYMKKRITELSLPILLGAQNISPYTDGAYTGEISARMVKEMADWVIIGHSERRKYFGEGTELLTEKVTQAKRNGMNVIYCVQNEQTFVPDGVDVVAYEPFWAIGTGKTDTPENASGVVQIIKEKTKVGRVIYGGSVIAENVASFVSQPTIDGVLPGGASLDANKFIALLRAASGV